MAVKRAFVALIGLVGTAHAEPDPLPTPHIRLGFGDGVLRGHDGHEYLVPQGSHVLVEDAWKKLDHEVLRLQERETVLEAENRSLRESASTWSPGWKTIVGALVVGMAGGWYVHSRF